MGHLIHRLGLIALATVVALYGCDRSSPDRLGRAISPEKKISSPRRLTANTTTDARRSPRRSVLNNSYEQHPAEEPPWLTAEFNDPDPGIRLQAMEAWAKEPPNESQETLDPLTYALVDPEESVRLRAQELLEEELARR